MPRWKRVWTAREDHILRVNWGLVAMRNLMSIFDLSASCIRKRAHHLGLPRQPHWLCPTRNTRRMEAR